MALLRLMQEKIMFFLKTMICLSLNKFKNLPCYSLDKLGIFDKILNDYIDFNDVLLYIRFLRIPYFDL